MKLTTIYTIVFSALLSFSCQRELPLQSAAGFIEAVSNGQIIVVKVTDSAEITLPTPRRMSFMLDDNTSYESSGLVEGNIVEVIYQPDRKESTALAIEIITDDTYPRALGRWSNSDNNLKIDIELLPAGKIRQHLPTQTIQFKSWQLTAEENIITLMGEVSLPPIIEKSAKSLNSKNGSKKGDAEQEVTPPARRNMAFTTTAAIGIDGDRRTLTIVSDKNKKSVLYRNE